MTTGRSTWLVDTNVPVYALDPRDQFKQRRAIEVLDRLDAAGTGILSVQHVNEFLFVVTRRLAPPVSLTEAGQIARYFLRYWRVLPLTPNVTVEAIRGVEQHRLAWWDALVWATAYVHGIPAVLSEDFNPGATLDGVRFVNPFDPAFRPAVL
jgi:predicted nucleic acid-binding protein